MFYQYIRYQKFMKKSQKKLFCYIEKTHSFQCQKYNKIPCFTNVYIFKILRKNRKKKFSVISKKYIVFKIDQIFFSQYFINIYDHKFEKNNQK